MYFTKKYIFLVFFLGLIPFACFVEPYKHYVINDFTLEPYKDRKFSNKINGVDSIGNDSVFIKLIFDTKFTSQINPLDLTNSAYAFRKPSPGHLGLRDPIYGINFFSDNIYNGRAAGANLNDLVNQVGYKTLGESSEILNYLNAVSPAEYPETEGVLGLYFNQRPTDNLKHTFTLQLIFLSGKAMSAQTTIQWK